MHRHFCCRRRGVRGTHVSAPWGPTPSSHVCIFCSSCCPPWRQCPWRPLSAPQHPPSSRQGPWRSSAAPCSVYTQKNISKLHVNTTTTRTTASLQKLKWVYQVIFYSLLMPAKAFYSRLHVWQLSILIVTIWNISIFAETKVCLTG
jgi:hypothetical protein